MKLEEKEKLKTTKSETNANRFCVIFNCFEMLRYDQFETFQGTKFWASKQRRLEDFIFLAILLFNTFDSSAVEVALEAHRKLTLKRVSLSLSFFTEKQKPTFVFLSPIEEATPS